MLANNVPLNDLRRQYQRLRSEIDQAVFRVLSSGWYILGPEVEAFERDFADFCHASHCIAVANGTDAIEITLKAFDVGLDDEVITVANAGMYSTTAIRAVSARPVYVDIDPITYQIDPSDLEAAITPDTAAIIVTHLYGFMADMPRIRQIADKSGLPLIEDCAQSHGAGFDGKPAGSWGDAGCFSFYPTKNLGALGDGGAIVTSDNRIAYRSRQLRQYGWDMKYHSHLSRGQNSRLDELQAAVLRVKLPHLQAWNRSRRRIASEYGRLFSRLDDVRLMPLETERMVFHLFVIAVDERDDLLRALRTAGIGSDIHYPVPDHLQPSCTDLGYKIGALPRTEKVAGSILSLPCFPELRTDEVKRVANAIKDFYGT